MVFYFLETQHQNKASRDSFTASSLLHHHIHSCLGLGCLAQSWEKEKMKWKMLVLAAILQTQFPSTEAQSFGLLDPKLCYLLDGILFLYGVIVTALFLRAKFSPSAEAPTYQPGQNQLYNELNLGRREEYDILDKRRALDPEMGGKQRRRNPQEGLYNALQKDKMAESYSEIGMKGERRRGKGHDGLYQGLSTATKDTYDALHMQTLPPR
ncbi:T-cell surface glycoprotein CD3 zeta chain isoform X2 [Perognathus longimembris pacificus]|uniref:T-cell surface glycoprotein CD3 zeta chain isoform X2 n=1 Tax=Perognathus longimembris pacificus TaxID=214514 RepID=UPI0020194702|nr:T-cell surface glycoprotein CD3 zeta chain isoform X2 [Perognathus longimembris pacificus]